MKKEIDKITEKKIIEAIKRNAKRGYDTEIRLRKGKLVVFGVTKDLVAEED